MPAPEQKLEWTAAEAIEVLRGLHVSGADLKQLAQLTRELVAEELERRVAKLKAVMALHCQLRF